MRAGGSFPRVLGRYSRDEGLITLEDAVRKMSALPAETFGLAPERGLLAVSRAVAAGTWVAFFQERRR